MRDGVAARLDLDQELAVIAICRAMNDEPDLDGLAVRFCQQPAALPLGWEALRRQRIYRERIKPASCEAGFTE